MCKAALGRWAQRCSKQHAQRGVGSARRHSAQGWHTCSPLPTVPLPRFGRPGRRSPSCSAWSRPSTARSSLRAVRSAVSGTHCTCTGLAADATCCMHLSAQASQCDLTCSVAPSARRTCLAGPGKVHTKRDIQEAAGIWATGCKWLPLAVHKSSSVQCAQGPAAPATPPCQLWWVHKHVSEESGAVSHTGTHISRRPARG